jgi:hypothetical protein
MYKYNYQLKIVFDNAFYNGIVKCIGTFIASSWLVVVMQAYLND